MASHGKIIGTSPPRYERDSQGILVVLFAEWPQQSLCSNSHCLGYSCHLQNEVCTWRWRVARSRRQSRSPSQDGGREWLASVGEVPRTSPAQAPRRSSSCWHDWNNKTLPRVRGLLATSTATERTNILTATFNGVQILLSYPSRCTFGGRVYVHLV